MNISRETTAPPPIPGACDRVRLSVEDSLLALTSWCSSLPVVGRHLEPISGLMALGLWGARYLPDVIDRVRRDRCRPGSSARRRTEQSVAAELAAAALEGLVPDALIDASSPLARQVPPFLQVRSHRQSVHRASIPYGDKPGQLLDVWRPKDLSSGSAPVLVFIPGGAWVVGSRALQGHALMAHLVEAGWVCVSMQYRASPRHRWPSHIIDVKTAIAWTRAHIAQFGGDPSFIAAAGCSAGGHLASLAGLTPNDPQFQPALPVGTDTSVDAVISIYGCYDWEDRSTADRRRFMEFLERVVVRQRQASTPHVFRDASPLHRVNPAAPPFLVIHGSTDALLPVADARKFVARLQAESASPVRYIELPGAGHGFDLLDGSRTAAMTTTINLFLAHLRRPEPGSVESSSAGP
jgi:acetyl esterase/lipase